MKAVLLSASVVLVALAGGAVMAQGKPDFTGTWRPVKMEAGGQSQDISTTQQDLRIKQDGAILTIFHPPDGSSSTTYKLDGTTSQIADGVAQASWVGNTIVINSTLGDDKIKTREVYSFDASGSLISELTAAPPLGDGLPARVTLRKIAGPQGGSSTAPAPPTTGASNGIPGFAPPAGFVIDERASKFFDFNHEEMGYVKPGAGMVHIDPEGKTWLVRMNVTPPNKTGVETDQTMRAALKAQGWDLYTPSGTLVAHRKIGTTEQWFKGAAFSGDYRATIIEVGPAPHAIVLPPPAASPETISDGSDFPYLQKFPGSTLTRTQRRADGTLDATAPGGAKEQLVGPPVVEKIYALPREMSTFEFMVVYRDALTKAGWTVIRTAAASDSLVVAHYAKDGRDIYAYLHNEVFKVADVGVASEATKLADALGKDGHVAIYGIYFDVDKSTLRPDSETALQHILELLKSNPALAVEIQGHTDSTGTPEHNKPLSEQRAASVQKWLVDHGIAGTRLTAKGYGETQPVGDNKTPEGRAKNRRVELKK